MTESTGELVEFPSESWKDALTDILREGARKMLTTAIEQEVLDYLDGRKELLDEAGRQLLVRNGFLPERELETPLGAIPVKQPRVRDRRPKPEREKFTSKILPPYLRKTKSLRDLLPWLYLKGVSTVDFAEALRALLGPEARGLSATTVTRLKRSCHDDYQAWSKRSLTGKRYVYVWADGVYFNIRLEDPGNAKQCILVLIGATADARKELRAASNGYRESDQSWREILLELPSRGMEEAPKAAVGDGALGFWAALRKIFPETREQRCWLHKTASILDKMPKSVQPKAKSKRHDIWMAETKPDAETAFDLFVETFQAKFPRAVDCLEKDRDVLLNFYDFPAEHWIHLRTTNPIESTFSTVRLRTSKTKGAGSRTACLTMVYKLARSAEKRWRTLNGANPDYARA